MRLLVASTCLCTSVYIIPAHTRPPGIDHAVHPCRRMYDCIIQCSPLLPAGVTLAEVLQGSAAADVKEIVASLPDSGTISAAAMISAGTYRLL